MSVIYKNLEDVCEILDSFRIPITAKNRKAGCYPYYGANGLQDHVADYIFDDELVLLAEDGGNFGSLERPIAYRVSGKCWVNNHAHVLKAKDCIDVDYLCYSLMYYNTDGIVNGATRKKLTQSAMRKMHIPLRSMYEQREIVSKIGKIGQLIEMHHQELEMLDKLVRSRFIEMFGDPENNPMNWSIVTVGEMVLSSESGWSGNGKQRKRLAGEIAVLKVSAVTKGYFIPEEYKVLDDQVNIKKYVYPQKGDLLFSRANTKEMVGATAIIEDDYPKLILSDKLWRIRFIDMTNVYYMKYILSSKGVREKFSAVSTGTSGSMYNVSMEKFKAVKIPMPPIELQNQFATFVHQTDKSKLTILESLEKLETLKKSLMQQYFG